MNAREDDLRVVVVAPTGRDGLLISNLLISKGIACVNSASVTAAQVVLDEGAGALIIAEEALTLNDLVQWTLQIADQPSWSDFPIILLTMAGDVNDERQRKMRARQPFGNLVLLERPIRRETLFSTVQAALRSRRRQYQMREFLVERRLAEEALRKAEKLAVVGRLAASIAHEINNPLESVTNLLYLIRHSPNLQEAKEYAEIASSELTRVSEIVTQSLRHYRQSTKPTMVSIVEIVNSALALYQARLTSAQIVIERDFRDCPTILAVAGELRQVILNLIGNALDAIGRGGRLKIRITSSREHSNGSRPGIRLTIADTGSGIPFAIRKNIFEPFVTTKGETGTGLGLWVSSEIVGKHGGKIQVRSNASSPTGTVFSVFLPAQPQFAQVATIAG
jgi:signal transduction histidine kinase